MRSKEDLCVTVSQKLYAGETEGSEESSAEETLGLWRPRAQEERCPRFRRGRGRKPSFSGIVVLSRLLADWMVHSCAEERQVFHT